MKVGDIAVLGIGVAIHGSTDALVFQAVLKVGINVQKELVQLGLKARSGVELRPLAQSTGCRALSLQGCAAAFLGIRVAKGQATSNWEAANLSQARVDTLRQTRGCAGRAMNSASQGQI